MFFYGSNDSLSRFSHFSRPLLSQVTTEKRVKNCSKKAWPVGSDYLLTFFEPESWHHGSLASKRPENQVSQNFRDSVAKEQTLRKQCKISFLGIFSKVRGFEFTSWCGKELFVRQSF